MVKRAASTIGRIRTHLAVWLSRLIAARKRRLEHERELYRKLNEYRRTHDLPLVDPDDWKTWIYRGIEERGALKASASILERHVP